MKLLRSSAAIFFLFIVAVAYFPERVAAQPPPKDPNRYVPGLGDLMIGLQVHHGKLWHAGEASNWELAAHEIDALKEAFADIVTLRPTFKRESIVEMLTQFSAGPLDALSDAVVARDQEHFQQAFDSLSTACNACHEVHGYGFIVLQRPTSLMLNNQRYTP